MIERIAVLTSGGDAPGMNAAIRAVVRTGIYYGLEVYGIRRGYQGLVDGDVFKMETTAVSNIIQRGGTMLKTARSKDFMTKEGRKKAFEVLQQFNINGLVLIGGDGTFRGANVFFDEYALPAIGVPGTIDNDIGGTDYTIGFDTAVNTAVEAIDKIRDTAEAHDRMFVIEVMGRDAGYIALNSGIACGAEDILVPEQYTNIDFVLERIGIDNRRKKLVSIIVVAEGDDFGGADEVKAQIMNRFPDLDVRSAILGHIQRGGSPTFYDRLQASRLGYEAVKALMEGKSQMMVGLINEGIAFTSFKDTVKQHLPLDKELLKMAQVLSA